VDGRLARHYGRSRHDGLAVDADAPFRRVRLDRGLRGGVLTQAGVLTVTSNPDRTSPVKRGKWVLDNLLDDPPPPPPPSVGNLSEAPEAVRGRTLRERLVQHRSERSCAVCHERMDALGFALEGFDPVGRPRTSVGALQVDDVGTLPDGRSIAGAAGLRELLAQDPRFLRALARKLFVYAVGRGVREVDARALDAALADLSPQTATFEELILTVVESDAFRFQGAAEHTSSPDTRGAE
jgi:hypothetical protein